MLFEDGDTAEVEGWELRPWHAAVGALQRSLPADMRTTKVHTKAQWTRKADAALRAAHAGHWYAKLTARVARPTNEASGRAGMRSRGSQPTRRVLQPTEFVGELIVKESGDDRLRGEVVSYDAALRYWHVRYLDGSTGRLGQKALEQQCPAGVECAHTPTPSELAIKTFLEAREPTEQDWYLRAGSGVAPYAQRQWAQLDTGSDFAVSRGKGTGPAEHTLCGCGQGCVETVQHAVLECPLYDRVRPALSSAFAAHAAAGVLADDSYELAPREALAELGYQ